MLLLRHDVHIEGETRSNWLSRKNTKKTEWKSQVKQRPQLREAQIKQNQCDGWKHPLLFFLFGKPNSAGCGTVSKTTSR